MEWTMIEVLVIVLLLIVGLIGMDICKGTLMYRQFNMSWKQAFSSAVKDFISWFGIGGRD